MAWLIREIVTEVALAPDAPAGGAASAAGPAGLPDEELDLVVRRCTERVLELLGRELDR